MPRKPSKECSSDGLNSAQLQRGHLRRIHSTRGSQLGQLVNSAFMQEFLRWKVGVSHSADPFPAEEFASSHASRRRMLPVAKAMLESAAP
jgi:hypothetical protein